MPVVNWLFLVVALLGLAALAIVLLAALLRPAPTPENRPAPPSVLAARDQARLDALEKIAARSRRQQQREASARLTRGF